MEEELDKILNQVSNLNLRLENLQTISTNPTTEMIIGIVSIGVLLLGFVLFFFFLSWQYKLKETLIKSKQYQSNSMNNASILSLLFGISGTLLGFPLCFIILIIEKKVNYSLLGGLIPFSLGMGMLIYYFFTRKKN